MKLRDLFEIVGRSDATEVLVDDRPVPYARELWLPLDVVSDSPVAARAAEPIIELDRELQMPRKRLRQLEAEYNMFFAGRLPRPPWETRTRVEALVKQLDRGHIQNYGDRFRFTHAAVALRGVHRSVGSRPARARGRAARAVRAAAAGAKKAPKRRRIASCSSRRSGSAEGDGQAARALRLAARGAARVGEETVPFHKFAELVKTQVEKLKKDGAPEVAFRVAVKDGKVNFTARGLKGAK